MAVAITDKQINTVFDSMDTIQEETPSKSTATDYLVVNSGLAFTSPGQEILREQGSTAYHPEFDVRNYSEKQQDFLDFRDKDFKAFYDKQDGETQSEMLDTNSNAEAYIVAYKRQAQKEAMENIQDDGLAVQIGMSIVPSLLNPSMLIPAAAVGGTLFKATTTAGKILGGVASGAIGGAVSNVVDETSFEAQGMRYSYPNAALYGAMFGGIFGGTLGTLGAIVTPNTRNSVRNAEIVLSDEQPGVTKIEVDPLDLEVGARGQDVAKTTSWVDWFTGGMVQDDVHIVYGSNSQVLRNMVAKLADAGVALKNTAQEWLPLGKTALSIRRNNMRFYSQLDMDLAKIQKEHTKEGYTRERLDEEASTAYHEMENKQELEAYEHALQKEKEAIRKGIIEEKELAKIRKEAREEYYSKEVDWNSLNLHPAVKKAAIRYAKYYDDVAAHGKELDIKKLVDAPKGKLYKPRIIKTEKADENLFDAVYKAFDNHPGNRSLTPEEKIALTEAYIEFIKSADFKKHFGHNSFVMPESTELPGAARLKGRTFRFDTRELTPYMETSLQDLTSKYNYQMVGNHALQEIFGTSDFHKIMREIELDLREEGNVYTPKEIEALGRVIRDIAGDLRMNPLSGTVGWTVTRSVTALNSLRFGGKFGYVNQVVELAANMSMNGIQHMVRAGFFDGFKAVRKMLYKRDGTPDNELAQLVLNTGFFEDALHHNVMNRSADSEMGFNPSKLEKGLYTANNAMMKYNGLRLVKSMQEYLVGGALLKEIPKLADKADLGKLSDAEMARITSWGLTPDELIHVANNIDEHFDGKTSIHLDQFDPDARDLLQLAVTKNMERSVLQGDSIYVPSRGLFNFKDSNMAQKLIFQFMRFPVMAHNTFLRRGFSQDRARMMGGIVGSMLAYMGWIQLYEQTQVALGLKHEYERQFDLNTEDGIKRALGKSLNYVGGAGMLTSFWNYGMTAMGYPELGTDYATRDGVTAFFGPSASWVDDALKLTRASLGNIEMSDEKKAILLKDITIGKTIPIVNEGIDAMIEDYF